jgi:hypothetical protein
MASKSTVAALLLIALGTASAILCPTTTKFNGCLPEGCMGIPTSRRTMDVVCDACGEGYVLAYRGTREAKCGEYNCDRLVAAACLALVAAVLLVLRNCRHLAGLTNAFQALNVKSWL